MKARHKNKYQFGGILLLFDYFISLSIGSNELLIGWMKTIFVE